MLDKKEGFEIARVGLILFVITAVAALILAVVNGFTEPIISQNHEKAQNEAMVKVLPGAKDFQKVEFEPEKGSVVREIFSADKGVVVSCAPNGYGGEISMVVGIDESYAVTGIEIISQSETAGLGANCTRDDFKRQFIGKTEGVQVVKNGASDNQVDAISSATITSKAVTGGVNEAIQTVKELRGDK